MPVHNYGVLKGRILGVATERDDRTPHYHIHVDTGGEEFRVSVNVHSRDRDKPELLFYVSDNYHHPITDGLPELDPGFHPLERGPDGLALDYIRGNLFDRRKMVVLPPDLPGEENDLNDRMDLYIRRAVSNPNAHLYAFGSRWGPERRADHIFDFYPGVGVHNIHMNQGNPAGSHARDNAPWQDGALFLHFPKRDRWVAMFLAFQSQAWHTDDRKGELVGAAERFGPAYRPQPTEPDFSVRILAALVNPRGEDAGRETVTLLNMTDEPITLDGWRIMDRGKRSVRLSGSIEPGIPRTIRLTDEVNLSNSGGIITLLNPAGLKVHGVHYTHRMAKEQGRSVVF